MNANGQERVPNAWRKIQPPNTRLGEGIGEQAGHEWLDTIEQREMTVL